MSKFKVGDVVVLKSDPRVQYTISEVRDFYQVVRYLLGGYPREFYPHQLKLMEEAPPLTKLQAMHNMLDGQVYTDGYNKYYVTLDKSTVTFVYDCGGDICELAGMWGGVSSWTPYTPPKEWYEEIPEGGVLCWVSDTDSTEKCLVRRVHLYDKSEQYPYTAVSCWRYATPILPEECLQPKEA